MPRFQIKRKRVDPEDMQRDEVKTEDRSSSPEPDPEFNKTFNNLNLKSPESSETRIHPPSEFAEDVRSEPIEIPKKRMSRREYERFDDPRNYQPQYRNRDDDFDRPEPNYYKRGRMRPVDTIRSRGEAGKLRYASRFGTNNRSLTHSEKVKRTYAAAFGDGY